MKVIRHIGKTVLAIALLTATMGFSVDKHYCMDRLMDLAINDHAETCTGMDFEDPMPCCEDVNESLRVEEITKVSFDFDAQPDLFLLTSVYYTDLINECLPAEVDPLLSVTDSSPPLVAPDQQVSLQVFRL